METHHYYRDCLHSELERRVQGNPSYSLRAFARALKIEPGALSQFLSGKRTPSHKLASRILRELDLSPDERNAFIASLASHQRSRGLKRMCPAFRALEADVPSKRELSVDFFQVIAEWYHYAIMLLAETRGFKRDPRWIASRLGISPVEVKLALERLLMLELLQEVDGKLRFVDQEVTTANKDQTAPALRRRQRQILQKAIESLENDPIDRRSMTGMTMAIDPAKLPQAKKLISEFNRKMSRFLESGEKTEVYEMQISLFPLQKTRSEAASECAGSRKGAVTKRSEQ